MTIDEKDRLGSKLREREKAAEDIYIAQREQNLLKEMREKAAAEQEAQARAVAHMRCPKCGTTLHHREWHGVQVEECGDCQGVWLDKGELEEIAGREDKESWIARWLRREIPTR